MTLPARFCPYPFERLDIQWDGLAYVCCPGWLKRPVGNAFECSDIDRLWNGPEAQEIRESILDNSFRYCEECPYLGVMQGPVKWVHEVDDPRHLAILRDRTLSIARIHMLMLGYDRTCNLACPSCRTTRIVASSDENAPKRAFQDALLAKLLPSLEWLYVTGNGDPFASHLYRELLRSIDARAFPDLKISLHTNGLLLTHEMWASLSLIQPAIKSVGISIDAATPETYVVNRPGGNWSTLMANLEFVSQLRRQRRIEELYLCFVVQQNNWREMADFVRLGHRFQADILQFTPLRNWGTFSDSEHAARAVHLAEHEEHSAFVASLADAEFLDRSVLLFTCAGRPAPTPSRVPASPPARAASDGPDPDLAQDRREERYTFTSDWFCDNVPVWTRLFERYRGKPDVHYLELGVYEGRSLIWMLDNILTDPTSRATAIDHFGDGGYERRYLDNLRASGAAQRTTTLRGLTVDRLRELPRGSFDIIYIDAGHQASDVMADAILCWPLLKDGGLLVFDDYLIALFDEPDDLLPRVAIDAFVTAYRNEIVVAHREYQLALQKVSNPCRSVRPSEKHRSWECSPIAGFLYYWDSRILLDPMTGCEVVLQDDEALPLRRALKSRPFGAAKMTAAEIALDPELAALLQSAPGRMKPPR